MRSLWFLLASFVVFLAGCSALEGLAAWWESPDPTTGQTPGETLGESIPQVIANPANIPAWLKIVGVLVAGGAVLFGAKKIADQRAKAPKSEDK